MSAMLYDLGAAAAQMCAPVPTAAGGWTDWLDHWQTLLGAAVGGVMGVAGALIVAGAQRRREQRVAAGMVLPDLQQLDAAGQRLEHRLSKPHEGMSQQARETLHAMRVVETLRFLAADRPKLFALHTPAIGQLSDVDARLYGHLFMCQMVHRRFEDTLASRRTLPDGPQNVGQRDYDLFANWKLCVEHAALARFWLENLVFSPWPRWVINARLKRHLAGLPDYPDEPVQSPDEIVKRSVHLLRTGAIFRPATAGEAGQP
jgi:hypothetical protein